MKVNNYEEEKIDLEEIPNDVLEGVYNVEVSRNFLNTVRVRQR